MHQDEQDVLIQGGKTVVEVEFPFRYDCESLQSLERKITALHRSMGASRDDKQQQVLTVITPRLLKRTSSSMSLVYTASSEEDDDVRKTSHMELSKDDERQWGYFAQVTDEPQRHYHFPQRETQLALTVTDKTRSLLQNQQMIHML